MLLDEKSQYVFVDRKRELDFLEKQYLLAQKGLSRGVLVYGLRRVGKTRLINEFLRDKPYISVNCGGLSTVYAFFYELTLIVDSKFSLDLSNRWIGLFEKAPAEKMRFKTALDYIAKTAEVVRGLIVFLDEFHLFIDKIASRVAREEKTNKERALLDLLWILKGVVENSYAFWILSASVGWGKLQEIIQMKHRESPLTGLLSKLEVTPLKHEHAVELAMKVNPNLSEITAEEISRLSGGIPKIIIELASRISPRESPIKASIRLLMEGLFDDIFDNIIRYAADLTKFDYTTIMGTIAAISDQARTSRDISRYIGFDVRVTSAILQELYKLGLLEKHGDRPSEYRLRYPLMESWVILKLKDRPIHDKIRRAIASLGLTAEAYVREMFMETIGKEIVLRDDKQGSVLAGTAESLVIRPTKVLSRKETTKLLSSLKIKNADIVLETEDNLFFIEVKAGIKDLDPEEIDKLAKIIDKLSQTLKTRVRGILIYMGEGTIPPTAPIKAKDQGILILTKRAIKLIARQINYPTI